MANLDQFRLLIGFNLFIRDRLSEDGTSEFKIFDLCFCLTCTFKCKIFALYYCHVMLLAYQAFKVKQK